METAENLVALTGRPALIVSDNGTERNRAHPPYPPLRGLLPLGSMSYQLG